MKTSVLPDQRVGNLMTIDPVTVEADTPIHEAEELLRTYRVRGVPVLKDGRLVGVLSQTDLLTAHEIEMIAANWGRLRVRHLMTSPAVTIEETATVADAARIMVDRHIHRLVEERLALQQATGRADIGAVVVAERVTRSGQRRPHADGEHDDGDDRQRGPRERHRAGLVHQARSVAPRRAPRWSNGILNRSQATRAASPGDARILEPRLSYQRMGTTAIR